MVNIEKGFHRCIDFKILRFKIARHSDIAIFIRGKGCMGLAAPPFGMKSPVDSIPKFGILSVEEPVSTGIIAGHESRELVFGEILRFKGASPSLFPSVF